LLPLEYDFTRFNSEYDSFIKTKQYFRHITYFSSHRLSLE